LKIKLENETKRTSQPGRQPFMAQIPALANVVLLTGVDQQWTTIQ
jgi:hypothetical protein